MIKKPEMKKNVAIVLKNENIRLIKFYTSPEILEGLSCFGTIFEDNTTKNHYTLIVDGRFEFGEVLDYMESVG